ncbi:MAG: hypothetical protein ACI4VQ_06205 [Clostridia bacterium]
MVDMFVDKMCLYCSNNKCNKQIEITKSKNYTTYKCNEYIKNKIKVVPYREPLVITAERKHITKKEI